MARTRARPRPARSAGAARRAPTADARAPPSAARRLQPGNWRYAARMARQPMSAAELRRRSDHVELCARALEIKQQVVELLQ